MTRNPVKLLLSVAAGAAVLLSSGSACDTTDRDRTSQRDGVDILLDPNRIPSLPDGMGEQAPTTRVVDIAAREIPKARPQSLGI